MILGPCALSGLRYSAHYPASLRSWCPHFWLNDVLTRSSLDSSLVSTYFAWLWVSRESTAGLWNKGRMIGTNMTIKCFAAVYGLLFIFLLWSMGACGCCAWCNEIRKHAWRIVFNFWYLCPATDLKACTPNRNVWYIMQHHISSNLCD
jgi:hypothetical protein